MQVILAKAPYEVSLSGNPMPYVFIITPYGVNEQAQDIQLQVKILVENVFDSGIFTEVKSQNFYPNSAGSISLDICSIINPYLSYYLPDLRLKQPLECVSQRKKYKIEYQLFRNGLPETEAEMTDPAAAIKGGLAYDQWLPVDFFTKTIATDLKPLNFFVKGSIVGMSDILFLYWIYPLGDLANQTVTIRLFLEDESERTVDLERFNCMQWGVCCAPIGLSQITLPELGGLKIVEFQVRVFSSDILRVQTPKIRVDHRAFYNTYQLLYRNSLGAMENIRVTGQVDPETDYNNGSFSRSPGFDYIQGKVILPQQVQENSDEILSFKANVGFGSKEVIDKLRDFFLSSEKYEYLNKKLIPIITPQKNAKLPGNKDSLPNLDIQWQRAYASYFYTPEELVQLMAACPALDTFRVVQLTKTTLLVVWSMPLPYNIVSFHSPFGDSTYTFYGNTGSQVVAFENPLDPEEGHDYNFSAKVICNPYSKEIETGPETTITVEIYGNQRPVANDDAFTTPSGTTDPRALAPSVLDNDYDPDGDAITAVPVVGGATTEGGSFDIDAAGIITYFPPSAGFSGPDTFTYEVIDAGGVVSVTANVTVVVGSVTSTVYVKITQVITSEVHVVGYWATSGRRYLNYYNNALGTLPKDVTGMGLAIEVQLEQDPGGTSTQIVYASGTSNLFYTGTLASSLVTYTHTILPGTGYTAI